MDVAVAELSRLLGQRLLRASMATSIARDALPLLDLARARDGGPGGTVAAVVLYGSCLLDESAAKRSEPDYFLVVDSLRAFHRSLGGALAGATLPPSVYHLRVRTRDGERSCKASVLSSAQLVRETSARARDLHQLGRFSKPLALVYARDDNAFRLVRDAQLSSLRTLAPHALASIERRFTEEEFLLALYGLSYRAEHRIIEPGKLRSILDADREAELHVARLLLTSIGVAADGEAFVRPDGIGDGALTRRLLARSRLRDLARWPKYLLTFDGWLEYVQRKMERNAGRRLQLTPLQQRHPLLFGWPALLALKRQGLLR